MTVEIARTSNPHPTFEQVLPYVLSARERGELVPFIGSGLSLPLCTGWRAFVELLAARASVPVPWAASPREPTPNEIYRVADGIVSALTFLAPDERREAYLGALVTRPFRAQADIPPSTRVLASGYWPLTLTTNYEDLFLAAHDEREQLRVFGRSLRDCHEVLRSLDTNQGQILWALQGFLGGPALPANKTVPDNARRTTLLSEMVVGHRQYQEAINASPHFRRAFGEVFRRRVLLFVGSGILEDYLVNLFSEIIHQYGTAPRMHLALVPKSREGHFDAEFLERRIGILPIFYNDADNDHSELTQFLDEIAHPTGHSRAAHSADTWRPSLLSFSCARARVEIQYGRLSEDLVKRPNTSVAVSIGRETGNVPLLGAQARVVGADQLGPWVPLDGEDSYAFRFGRKRIFGIAARRKGRASSSHDVRDLSVLADAVECALGFMHGEAATVHISGIATGQGRKWHPVFSAFETLRGIGRSFRRFAPGKLQRVVLHCGLPEWAPIVAGKVPILELLSSDVFPYSIELVDEAGRRETSSVVLPGSVTVGELRRWVRAPRQWLCACVPRPGGGPFADDEQLVVPYSTVVFQRGAHGLPQ